MATGANADGNLKTFAFPHDLDTPCIVVDLDRAEGNIRRMQEELDRRGVKLRPHTKTHKSVGFARMQLDAGASGLTTAVLGEAAVLADAGLDDIFVAYPVHAVGSKARRVRDLHERITLAVGVDSADGAETLGRAVAGSAKPLRVLVEIDCGEARTGVSPEGAVLVAKAAEAAGLDVVGVFTHAGHSYSGPGRAGAAADDEVLSLGQAASGLSDAGFDVRVVSAGSTPTAVLSARGPVNEERPGTYIFGDRQQAHLGGSDPKTIALVVAATVVSTTTPKGFVVDAGAKTLAKDLPKWLEGYGAIPQFPGAIIRNVYDHHGVVELPLGARKPSVGDVVAVVPNHVCPVVNLSNELVIIRGGKHVDTWPVDGRGIRS